MEMVFPCTESLNSVKLFKQLIGNKMGLDRETNFCDANGHRSIFHLLFVKVFGRNEILVLK